MRDLVDQDLVGKLNGEAIPVDRNLLDIVLTPDPNLLLGHKVLDDDICHVVSVSVPVLVKSVHGGEDHLVHHDAAIVAADANVVLPWPNSCRPDPILALAQVSEHHAVAAPELHLLVAAGEHKVLTTGEEVNAARLEVQLVLATGLLTRHLVEGNRLVPASHDQDVCRVCLGLYRVPRQCPNGGCSHHIRLLLSELVSDANMAAEKAQSYVKAVICPRHGENLGVHLALRHRLLLRRPEAQVRGGAGGELLSDRVVRKTLDGLIVVILEDALCLVGPDDDLLVRTSGGELLAVPRVSHAENTFLVSFERVNEVAIGGVVDQHSVSRRDDDLATVRFECDTPDTVTVLLPLRDLVLPQSHSPHEDCTTKKLRNRWGFG
mmetsp:Transcript_15563/g.27637  ORF Transcript_15563/g.27637 Transcript_15563/m.27637 type:complete len:377 (-) Transcript_15563:149-1279(-)